MNPRKVNCADLTPPPTVGRPSSTTQRKPAFARYAAVTRLLCPAPATTMSKRSGAADCRAIALSGVSARGASAAPFTNPRRVIPLILGLLLLTKLHVNAAHLLQSFFPNRSFVSAMPVLLFRLRPDATIEGVPIKLK